MLLQPNPTRADQSIARYLLPRLISFVTNTSPEDPENGRGLVANALAQYATLVATTNTGENRERASAAMALVVPTLLARASGEGDVTYRDASARLLELAGADQSSFKAVMGGMSEGQKAFLEEVIRAGRDAAGTAARNTNAGSTGQEGQPTIELKMNFGGA